MNQTEFYSKGLEKVSVNLKSVSKFVAQSFEIESMTKNDWNEVHTKLGRIGKGFPTSESVNDGNGWNRDSHHDGSLTYYDEVVGYGTETSTSPLKSVSFKDLKQEIKDLSEIYKFASGGVYHTSKGSCHVHNTIAYDNCTDGYNNKIVSVIGRGQILTDKMYPRIAFFFLKFMPVLKWFAMTNIRGARAVHGSSYDRLERDDLFTWYNSYKNSIYTHNSHDYLENMGRDSYLRIYRRNAVHFENRMMDCTFSPTHLATWLTINKAITLWAYDFAIHDYPFVVTDEDVDKSNNLMCDFRRGIEYISRHKVKALYKELLSYLSKYFKILGSMEVIQYMDKLIENPIPKYLIENNIKSNYDMDIIEKVFNMRNKNGDLVLRDRYLSAIKEMSIKHADNLNLFHENVAYTLGIDISKAKSLYQMFNRENVEIEFLGGRLVYMGD